MSKEHSNQNDGKNQTSSDKGLPPEDRKKQTTEAVEAKINALSDALKNRAKDRFYGLPKSITAFLEWRGEGDGRPLEVVARPTLYSRKDLKEKVQEVLKDRKNTPEENVAKREARIAELEL